MNTTFAEKLKELRTQASQNDFLFESVTEYDIDRSKQYDMHLGGAKGVSVTGYDGEKIRIRLASNQLSSIQSDLKVKIDETRDCLDIDVPRAKSLTEADAKAALYIAILIPKKYIYHVELAVNAETVELTDIECDEIELGGKVHKVVIDGIASHVEIDCNLDMDIVCRSLQGRVELNQISATSRISLPEGCKFRTSVKGIGNSVSYERDGKRSEDFSTADAENVIELNGMKSELVIASEV